MGKKKKFIDKKKSATFQLVARDISNPSGLSGDFGFLRVDSNPYPSDFLYKEENEPSSSLGDDYNDNAVRGICHRRAEKMPLPDQIRMENLQLGFPDDGYNYLAHMREIKNTGGGSTYYHNHKAKSGQLSSDVKAYDASVVELSKISDVLEEKSMYSVASKMVGVSLEKVVDPEVAAILNEIDSSNVGWDVEDLDEDFVINANLTDDDDGEKGSIC